MIRQELLDTDGVRFINIIQIEHQVASVTVPVTERRFIRIRLLVGGNNTFVVSQNHLVGRPGDQVIRHNRYFTATAGSIDHVCRHTEATGVTNQALQDFYAFTDRCPEMGQAF